MFVNRCTFIFHEYGTKIPFEVPLAQGTSGNPSYRYFSYFSYAFVKCLKINLTNI